MASEHQGGTRSLRRTRDFTGFQTQKAEAPSSSNPTPSSVTTSLKDKGKESIEAILEIAQLQRLAEERQKKEWAAWAEGEFAKCKSSRAAFERQWYINLAFTNGRHYVSPVDVPGQGFRLTAPRSPSWRVKLVVNKIRTAVRKECSKLSSSRPIPTVVPATNETEDFTAAQVAEQLLKAAFANADFERTYRSWIWWGTVCGVSYLKSYWAANVPDTDMMKPQQPRMGADGQPLRDEEGNIIMMPPEPIMGKIMMERITPFHVYVPDLLAEDINKQPYLIHCTTRSPLWVEKNFGFKPTCDVRASATIMEASMLITKNAEEHLDSVMVKEIWIKPGGHKDFPDGGLMTVINNKVVQSQTSWPWPFVEYPFYKYDGIPTGCYYSDSMVVDLIPLNKEYNRTKSQMIEIKNTMGKPKLLYPKGSINPRQISSDPAQGIPYTQGFERPTVLPAAEVPATMGMELDRLTQDFDDLSGQHEISRGGTPSQVTSGTAIAYLQEQDDTTLTYQVASIEYAMELLGKHYLKYVSHYWTEERLIKTAGKDSTFEARSWRGRDLRGNTDVRVQTGSALPVSKAAKQAMISEFMQYGWVPPVDGMEALDLGMFSKILSDMLVDKKQASRENAKMMELKDEEILPYVTPPTGPDGQPQLIIGEKPVAAVAPTPGTPDSVDPNTGEAIPGDPGDPGVPAHMEPIYWKPEAVIPVNSWDDHQQHIHYHNQFRKTQEFELLSDLQKQQFEIHVQMHNMAMMGALEGQMGRMTSHLDPEMMQQQQSMEQGDQQMQQSDDMHQQQLASGEQEMQQGADANALANMLTHSQIAVNQSRLAVDQSNIEKNSS